VLRRQKEKIVSELHGCIKDSRLVVFTTFGGMNVEKMTELRNLLREADSGYRVVKNTLIEKASSDTDLDRLEAGFFEGPSALLFTSADPVRPCKVLKEFMRRHEQLTIKGGVLDGTVLSGEKINELAELPSREVLLSKLFFLLRAPTQRFVTVLAGVPQALVRVLEAIRQKKQD